MVVLQLMKENLHRWLTAAELASVDEAEAAGYDEITRLFEMNVLQEPTAEDLEEGVVLSWGLPLVLVGSTLEDQN